MIEYLIPPKNNATTQGEHVLFDIDVKGGEKNLGAFCCHQCQRGRLLEMFNRLSLMSSTIMNTVIDGHQKHFGKKLQRNLDKIRRDSVEDVWYVL